MRPPGFVRELAPNSDNSVQWLAKRIIADARFAEATVKFWWPSIIGSELAEPPADEDDADFEGLLLAANSQAAEATRLARGFRPGFRLGRAYNLKDLLVEMVLSRWFRADALEDAHPVRRVALRHAGARRLLTPEELDRKTLALTGVQWGRGIRTDCWPECKTKQSALSDEFRLLYGGIDSDGITQRSRDVNSVMAGVAKLHAAQMSCPVVMRELYFLPESERRLFAGVDTNVTPVSEFGAVFEIDADRRANKDTFSLRGTLTAGSKAVRLTYSNDYWEGPESDRNLRLDRIDVRNDAGRVIASHELENLDPLGDCNHPVDDHFALHCNGSLALPIDIPATGAHQLDIVAWADQAGDDLPRLNVVIESTSGGSAGETAIRNKLVELHDRLLGVEVTPHSPDIEAAYQLFAEVVEHGRAAQEEWFESWNCPIEDVFFFEGIFDDTIALHDNMYGRYFGIDWNRVDPHLETIDWSDPYHAAQSWVVVLAYLMMDYRYLYL